LPSKDVLPNEDVEPATAGLVELTERLGEMYDSLPGKDWRQVVGGGEIYLSFGDGTDSQILNWLYSTYLLTLHNALPALLDGLREQERAVESACQNSSDYLETVAALEGENERLRASGHVLQDALREIARTTEKWHLPESARDEMALIARRVLRSEGLGTEEAEDDVKEWQAGSVGNRGRPSATGTECQSPRALSAQMGLDAASVGVF